MDTNNKIVKLCTEGMQAEMTGRHDEARQIFEQAWAESENDYEACVAAHYLARHQETPEATLQWNQESLNRAEKVGDASVISFYPSLYLNLGYSYEVLGDAERAQEYYRMAQSKIDDVPDSPYKEIVQNGIAGKSQRTL